jgi:putative membrane-bound dehydrogenase-like protein
LLGVIALVWLPQAIGSAQDSLEKDYSPELPRIAPTEADAAITSFELSPNLKMELLAAEPLVVDPVAIAFDENGRAYVVEMRGYSLQADQQISRIRLLEDRDHDGRYETASVFVDGLRWPTAVVCVAGGILVGDAPDIIFFKDLDGDRRSDVCEVVFRGFGTSNVQQLLNNFQWGIDNRIYGASGGNGGVVSRVATRELVRSGLGRSITDRLSPVDLRGRDFAIDVLSMELEATSGGGQFGLTFDDWGNRFVCSNSDHCQQFVVEDRHISRNSQFRIGSPRVSIAEDGPAAEVFRISPIEPWRLVRTRLRAQGIVPGPLEGGGRAAGYFTSATGITFYDGDALPAEYADCFFIGDVGSNLVHRKRLIGESIQKSVVRTESQTEFLRSTDNWFRPVQFAVGPEGSLLVLDMYRETVEHPASLPLMIQQHLDLSSGNDRGRIYRIVRRDFQTPRRKLPGDATTSELVDMLGHSNGWHRSTAARLLFERWPESSADLLKTRGLSSMSPIVRIRAMYLLADFSELDVDYLATLLDDESPHVRVHSVRIAERFLSESVIVDRLCEMVGDADVRVRFQVAMSLGELDGDAAADAIARLAVTDGAVNWMPEALASSAGKCRAAVIERLLQSQLMSPVEKNGGQTLLQELVRQVAQDSSESDLREVARSVSSLSDHDSRLAGELLLQMTTGNGIQVARVRNAFGDNGVRFASLVTASVDRASLESVDEMRSLDERVAAISMLRLASSDLFVRILPVLLALRQAPEIREAALSTALYFSDEPIAGPILQQLPTMNPEIRAQAMHVLLSRQSWTIQLLEDIAIGRLSPVFLDAVTRQNLMHHSHEEIVVRAKAILDTDAKSDRAAVVDSFSVALETLQGDVPRGRDIFRKSCMACHRLENVGNEIGPNLAAFANRGTAAILVNLLDPNREVDSRYLAYSLLLEDGRTSLGIIASETANSITLQTSDGKSTTFLRNEVDEMQSTTMSLMPEYLEKDISHQGMADLIAYLLSQRG